MLLFNNKLHHPSYIILCIFCLFVLGCQTKEIEPLSIVAKQPLTLTVDEEIIAGDTLRVKIEGDNIADDTPVNLMMMGSYGSQLFVTQFKEGEAVIKLSESETRRSGFITWVASTATHSGEAQTIINAHDPIEPLTPLVGARSIIADRKHWSMTVIVPFDKYGNSINRGTPFTIRTLHPDGRRDNFVVETDHLLAWKRIYSHTTAGKTLIAVEGEGVYGSEAVLEEIAGWPVPFAINANPPELPADGRQFVQLQTDVIRDKHDNIMPDGTVVHFVVESAEGQRILPSFTLDGIAEMTLQAAESPQTIAIYATIFDTTSEELAYTFTQHVTNIPISTTFSAETLTLNAGPILGHLNQYAPDGTSAKITIRDADNIILETSAEVDAGYIRADIRVEKLPDAACIIEIEVGGIIDRATFVKERD